VVAQFGAQHYADAPVARAEDLGALGWLVELSAEPRATADLEAEGQTWAGALGGVELPEVDLELRRVKDEETVDDEVTTVAPMALKGAPTHHSLLVKAPVAAVAAALAAHRGGEQRADLDAGSLDAPREAFLVFRLAGASWSVVLGGDEEGRACPTSEDAGALSTQLGVDALFYGASEAVDAIGYDLYSGGALVEHFGYVGHDLQSELQVPWAHAARQLRETLKLSHGVELPRPGAAFASVRRKIDPETITDPLAWVTTSLAEMGAEEPGLTFDLLVDGEVDPATIERLDLVLL
jgi:hypothetical protein